MKVKPKQTMAHNKLLLLYLLEKSGMALSELQLVRIMTELSFMGYFDLKECIFELEQGGHIYSRTTPQNTVYGITDAGINMLDVLVNDLRLSFRETVDAYLKEHRSELELESQLVGEYIKLAQNEYRVILKVLEHDRTIFEINSIVYSKQEAQKIVDNWRKNAVSIYKDVVLRLG
ncbi:DUF4364 family protein [Christensenella intestinihominis]|uniref:DUF4364 family protein n=1 Tax=Christensenella intestinihominis TaxID=1851429 RepID=UPI0008356F2C|nr:DUF4364 family protein [Christensenella intestinihominis]